MTGRTKMAIFWPAIGLAWFLAFIGGEGYALLQSDPDAGLSLSRFVYQISRAWPPLVAMSGLTTGALVEHFWRYLDVDWRPDIARHLPRWLRWSLLAIAWLIIVLLTDQGPAIFLCFLPIGMLVSRLWWAWDPRDPKDRRG